MKNYLYVLFHGEYSDWECVGYTETLREAKKVCDCHADEHWYYEKVYKRKARVRRLYYEHCFWYDIFNKRYEMNSEYRCRCYSGKKPKNCVVDIRDNPFSLGTIAYQRNAFCVGVYLDKEDKERAKKIAQDLFAKWQYEQAETGKI